MDGSPQIPWEWMESTGLLGNLQQDFCGIALRNVILISGFNKHNLPSLILPIHHITFNQIERQEEKKSWYETILFFPFDKHL